MRILQDIARTVVTNDRDFVTNFNLHFTECARRGLIPPESIVGLQIDLIVNKQEHMFSVSVKGEKRTATLDSCNITHDGMMKVIRELLPEYVDICEFS